MHHSHIHKYSLKCASLRLHKLLHCFRYILFGQKNNYFLHPHLHHLMVASDLQHTVYFCMKYHLDNLEFHNSQKDNLRPQPLRSFLSCSYIPTFHQQLQRPTQLLPLLFSPAFPSSLAQVLVVQPAGVVLLQLEGECLAYLYSMGLSQLAQ